jgi:hypothetical protein
MLEIWALRPSFLNKFTLVWHHAFAPCAQLFKFSPRFWVRPALYALRPTFMTSTQEFFEKLTYSHHLIFQPQNVKTG